MSVPWTQIERLFEAALGVPAAERGAWLDGHCADPALRREVAGLLAAHARTGVLDASLADLAAGAASAVGELPARVGPYRVVREVGRGGMGVVVEAHDPRLGRPVALKFLPPGASAEDDARFLTEARAASQLDHPHVGTVYDVGQTEDGRRWIAMAYYSGPSLAERIAEGPLPVEEAVRLAGEVADGLGAAHAAGLVHRDVKPANVVLTAQGTAKVLDFGVAKGAGEGQTRAGVRFGTLAYMAPEQVRADAVDARADLWALGVVLYELLTGRLPFDEEDPAALLLAILDREPPPVRALRPEVPEALERVVRQALAKDPARRFATAEAFATALRDAQAGAPARASSALPAPLTSFVGREVEVERLGRLLEAARLVTLTGPAGTGKTRLAVEAARRIEHGFADGAAFVPLAPVRDPALVPSALAQALGVEASGPALPDALADALRGCELLLVLDNFEQVTAAAPAVGALLGACPRLRVLATSRVPLRLSGEREAPVPPLAVPEPEATPDPDGLLAHAAVRLFVERAQAVDPAFALTPENAAAVAALCARLDGLPLAIELAAARTKLFAPAALLARLGHRLDLLANRMHDRPARHHTLRQALAWSYDLLGPEEQRLYRRLGVFRGGCTIEAAEAVAGLDGADDVLDGLAALVDHSLLRTTTGADGEPRFEMLETVRTFALERLAEAGERAEAQGAHAHHVLDLAERAAPELTGAEQGTWLDRLDAEHDNLRAALDAAEADGDTGLGLRLGTALWRFWLVRGHLAEGRRRLERLLAEPDPDVPPTLRAGALHGLGTFCHNAGDNAAARACHEEALALYRALGDEQGMADELNSLAWVASELSDLDAAEALAQEALALCTELGDVRGQALALNNLGWIANYRGDGASGRAFHGRSLALRDAIGDRRGVAFALTNLAWADVQAGEPTAGTPRLAKAERIVAELGDLLLLAWVRTMQAEVACAEGRSGDAEAALEEAQRLGERGGNLSIRAWSRMGRGEVALERGEADRAREGLEAGLALWAQCGSDFGAARARYGLARWHRRWGAEAEAEALARQALRAYERFGDARRAAACRALLAPSDG